YHADHLGSTGYVTDANGDLYQHIEYFPFGETWVEEASNTQRTPYLFTTKELDEETDLYYYGARYYDPRTSVWQSTDPILEQLGTKKEDVPELARKLSLYAYSRQNPIVFSDPDGRDYEILIGGPFGNHRYGHAALRVFGRGYDYVLDFGRYDRTWGILGTPFGDYKGDGVFRIWNNFNQYIERQNRTGRTTTGYVIRTTRQEDMRTLAYYGDLAGVRTVGDGFVQYDLTSDYHALTNNCTTMVIAGIQAGVPALGADLANPQQSIGRGLSGFERFAAGSAIGSRIFMPEDLRANIRRSSVVDARSNSRENTITIRTYRREQPRP
ncbi:MAG TPA: RHS repeat-associated core domain-containing protein, partial [Herpetosiphonaceae bacterium]